MKKQISLVFLLIVCVASFAQNVGVGTSAPVEKLDIDGAVKIGGTSNTNPGTIRWNEAKKDFEGFNGSLWVSLTGNKGSWGSQESYTMPNFSPSIKLLGTTGHSLGISMCLSGDYCLLGSPHDLNASNGLSNAGSITVMKNEGARWRSYSAVGLPSPSPAINERFGTSVWIDGNSYIVGAPGANSNKGKVYIYDLGQLSGTALLTPPELTDGDHFGESVSKSGYFIAIGAPNRNVNTHASQGKVYISQFNPVSNTWVISQGLEAPDGQTGDNFGSSVSISGSYLAVAAPRASQPGDIATGKVYLFHFNGNTWQHQATLNMPSPIGRDHFGQSLHLKNDTLIVGAPQFNGYLDIDGKGKVFVYVRNGTNWELRWTLEGSDGKKSDSFGQAVFYNNGQIIVGCKYAEIRTIHEAGKAYIFRLQDNVWREEAILAQPVTENEGYFGRSVVVGDGFAIVAAPGATYFDRPDHGRIYFYYEN